MKKIILTAAALFCITCVNAQADTSGRAKSEQNTSEIPNVMYKYSDNGDNKKDGLVEENNKQGQRSDTVRHHKTHKRSMAHSSDTTNTKGTTARRKKSSGTNPSGPQK